MTFSQKITFLLQNNIDFIYLKVIWSRLPTNSNKGQVHLEIVQELLKNHKYHIAKFACLLHFYLQIFPRNAHFPKLLALLATKILNYIGKNAHFVGLSIVCLAKSRCHYSFDN